MHYKHAWYLLETLDQGFRQLVVETAHGGRGERGSWLTSRGETLMTSDRPERLTRGEGRFDKRVLWC
jgi:molybdate transport repressor ModE-like protein